MLKLSENRRLLNPGRKNSDLREQTRVRSFFWGADFKLRFKILIPTKTTRKAATMRFVVSPCVLDCIKGSYTGVFRGFNLNHVIFELQLGFY